MSFELTILGCSSATPTSSRNPTSQLLNVHERYFLIDCGEATQIQLRRFKLKFSKINHIFISHLHGDHYLGLIGLLSSFHLLGRTTEMHLYCHPALKEIIDIQFKHSDTYLKFPIVYHFLQFDESKVIFEDKKVKVETILLNHRVPCVGFLFTEKIEFLNLDKQRILFYKLSPKEILVAKRGEDVVLESGERIANEMLTLNQEPIRKYAFCSDTCYDERILPMIQGVDLLYHEATFAHDKLQRAKETFHSTTIEAGTIAKKANAKKLIIGHFSARYKELEPLLDETKTVFENAVLAEEGKSYFV